MSCCLRRALPSESVDLTPQSFRSQVLLGQDHWVLDFYAPWCGPCQHFAPEFEVLARVSHFLHSNSVKGTSDFSSVLKRQQVAQMMTCVWPTDSEREGACRQDRLSGSSTHLSVSWNQLLPHCQILPLPGNTEGNTVPIIYSQLTLKCPDACALILWCVCVYSMNKVESTSTVGMLIRLPTLSDSDYTTCCHSRKTNQRFVSVDVNFESDTLCSFSESHRGSLISKWDVSNQLWLKGTKGAQSNSIHTSFSALLWMALAACLPLEILMSSCEMM